MDTGIESVTIVIVGKSSAVELTQEQPKGVARGRPLRSGKDLLDTAVRDARSWLRSNSRGVA